MAKFEWKNGVDGGTPLSADNLNAMQDGIYEDIEKHKYELITNGEAVKTGRKIDGKDEYIKRFGFSGLNVGAGQEFSKPLGFTLSNAIITGYEGASKSNSGNWFYFTDSTATTSAWGLYFALYKDDNTIKISTMNANMIEAYINVKYIITTD